MTDEQATMLAEIHQKISGFSGNLTIVYVKETGPRGYGANGEYTIIDDGDYLVFGATGAGWGGSGDRSFVTATYGTNHGEVSVLLNNQQSGDPIGDSIYVALWKNAIKNDTITIGLRYQGACCIMKI